MADRAVRDHPDAGGARVEALTRDSPDDFGDFGSTGPLGPLLVGGFSLALLLRVLPLASRRVRAA